MSEVHLIEQLIRRERFYRDTDQWQKWRACYHPDSSRTHINISWFKGPIDTFVQRSQSLSAAGVSPTHTVTPADTTVHGTRALSVSTAQIQNRFEYAGAEYDLVADLRLVSRLERLDDAAAEETAAEAGAGWRLLTLEGIYLHDRIVPVFPFGPRGDAPAGEEEVRDPRPSYRCLIWNIERKGMTARRDLPGIDRPEGVREMMEGHERWVRGVEGEGLG